VLTVKSDVRENVGGPVAIFYAAGVVAEEGFFEYATLIGMISVSLGLVNLLPIPVLDGGQILFFLVELIRGRPLSIELREKVQIVSVLGLAITMLLVIVNDISRIVVL
jgi:regulator of sigma E protease